MGKFYISILATVSFQTADIFKNETVPLFSQCFQHTVLVWVPVLFLFCLSPILIFQITLERASPLPWTRLLIAKLVGFCFLLAILHSVISQVLTLILLLDGFFLFLVAIYEAIATDITNTVDFIYPLLLTCAMILMAVFITVCQRFGKVTSGGMFLTWVLFVVCGLPELYWWIANGTHPTVSCLAGGESSNLLFSEVAQLRCSSIHCVLDLVSNLPCPNVSVLLR